MTWINNFLKKCKDCFTQLLINSWNAIPVWTFTTFVSFVRRQWALICRHIYQLSEKFSLQRADRKENYMVAILDKEIDQVIAVEVSCTIHNRLDQIRPDIESLERIFQKDCKSAEIADDFTRILRSIDELDGSVKLKNIAFIMEKIEATISCVKDFHEKHKTSVPNEIFGKLHDATKFCKNLIQRAEELLEALENISAAPSLEDNSGKEVLEIWAVNYTEIARVLEEIPDFPKENVLDLIERLSRFVLGKTTKKYSKSGRREIYRKQLRTAANSVLVLIGRRRLSRLESRSAESKAIERLRDNQGTTEWITVHEPEQEINIDKINARLRKRGYNIQVSHQNPPSSQN